VAVPKPLATQDQNFPLVGGLGQSAGCLTEVPKAIMEGKHVSALPQDS